MIIFKVAAVSSSMLLAGIAQVDPLVAGKSIGGMNPAQILGVVCVVCVIGVVYVNRSKDALMNRLYEVIEKSIKEAQRNADHSKEVAGVLVELKDAVNKCGGSVETKR